MKLKTNILLIIMTICTSFCVQKSSIKTFVLELNTAGIENIEKVGVRGNGNPLNWQSDFPMERLNDSIFRAVITVETAQTSAVIKFTINDEFELKDKPNREVVFTAADTLVYKARFDVEHEIE